MKIWWSAVVAWLKLLTMVFNTLILGNVFVVAKVLGGVEIQFVGHTTCVIFGSSIYDAMLLNCLCAVMCNA